MKNDFNVNWTYRGIEHRITGIPAAVIALALFFVFCLGVLSLAFILIGFFV